MENQELIKQVTEKAEKWLTPAYDAETQAEVKRMLENEDKTELIEAFYKDLEFGTGGLRGIMGVGSNRMNIYGRCCYTGAFQLSEEELQRSASDFCSGWARLS